MESKFCFVFLLIFCTGVQSASIFESGYDYLMNFGKSLAPNFLSILECMGDAEPWGCARERAGKLLDGWGDEVNKERSLWEEEADTEVRTSGRSIAELPSKLGREITESLGSLANVLERSYARALESKKHDGGGIDSITISTGGGDKKKMKKKKPPKIHLIHPMVIRKAHKEEKGRNFGSGIQSWVIGERSLDTPETIATVDAVADDSSEDEEVSEVESRGAVADLWAMGKDALDTLAEHVVENENTENGVEDRSSFEDIESAVEQRGKKKKKKKAILKLLVLGAVIKAKIATLLQILTYKLQIKFFIIAVLSLAVNIARLWLDLKNKHNSQPQKEEWRRNGLQSDPIRANNNIIYYEHAQHQHHYDHEEEEASHGWGPWSRSIFPNEEETETEESNVSAYRAQERNPQLYSRPYMTHV